MPENQLLEISLTVEDELVEPVAEVLARYVKGGVAIESTAVSFDPINSSGAPVGPLRVFGYLTVDDRLEQTRQKLEESLWYLGRIRPLPEPQYRTLQESDWAEAWKKDYHPIPIGRRLMIVPAWLKTNDTARTSIRIDPGMAFGTGTHPSTQLCLELLEDFMESVTPLSPPVDVIDLGCGTAILAIAALKLGASRALGVDIDADAVRAARENARANLVESQLEIGLGSLDAIQQGEFSIRKADLALANILAPVCIRLLDEGLARLLNPAGRLVLAGILDEQAEQVAAAARRSGLRLDVILKSGDWVALAFSLPD
jgi:ribosomal protein L11 methyltransferase